MADRRRTVSAILLAVSLVLSGGVLVSAADPAPSSGPAASSSATPVGSAPPGMTLVWADEFDAPAGTPPDPARWAHDLGDGGQRPPRLLYGTLHGPGCSGSQGYGGTLLMDEPLADGFHVYAVDWTPEGIAWTVDGVIYHEATPADVAPEPWVYDRPFFLLLNLAVGGHFGQAVSTTTVFPASYLVDHVRVYQAAAPG